MRHLPTTRQIQFLLAIKQHGSFNRAAIACSVTQSTLSAAIQEMENILGGPVIDRTMRKTVRFTPLGATMLVEGQKIIDALTHIARQARHDDQSLSWPLRLGMIPTIAPYWLPKLLHPLQEAFPKLMLHVHEMQSSVLVEQINDGKIDFGIMALPFDTKNLQTTDLHSEPFCLAAPQGFLPNRSSISLDEIAAQKILLLSDGHCLRDHALAACDLKTPQHVQDVSATSMSTLIHLVAQNYGVTLLPEMIAHDASLPQTIKNLLIAPVAPMRRIAAVWRKKSPLEQDIRMITLAIYRLIKGFSVHDDMCHMD